MSRESMEWLNLYTLIGFTDKRGNAWHYRRELQGIESNHYVGPIPPDDVIRRLFNWQPMEREMFMRRASGEYIVVPGRKLIVRSDNDIVLGAFKDGYQPHPYDQWLLENIATIIDDELGIASAGLLRNGGQAWVSVEVPDTVETPEGVEFRPNLTATSSCDGTIATTFFRHRIDIVCDNTRDIGIRQGRDQQYKVKHTKYSNMKIMDAREALQIVHKMTEEFSQEIAALCAWKVSDDQFMKHLQIMVPINDELSKAGITKAENKRNEITVLYKSDPRVAPWTGTAFGVSAAYNTWRQHFAGVRKGVPRQVRNMENLLAGKTAAEDGKVLEVLASVTS